MNFRPTPTMQVLPTSRPGGTAMLGAIELHFTQAWPTCEATAGFQQCADLGPTCAKSSTPIEAPMRRRYIFEATGPCFVLG